MKLSIRIICVLMLLSVLSLTMTGCSVHDTAGGYDDAENMFDVQIFNRPEVSISDGNASTEIVAKITNNTGRKVMQIDYDLVISDDSGNEVLRVPHVYNGQDHPVKKGETLTFDRRFREPIEEECTGKFKADIEVTGFTYLKDMKPVKRPATMDQVSEMDGIRVKLKSCTAEMKFYYGGVCIFPVIEIENRSDMDLMKVDYSIDVFADGGKLLGTFQCSYMADETPVYSDTAVKDEGFYLQKELDGQISALSVRITGYETTETLKPVELPKKGDYLYMAVGDGVLCSLDEVLPEKIVITIDKGGNQNTCTLTDLDEIANFTNMFRNVMIGGEGMSVTDNYNSVVFYFEDGRSASVNFELDYLSIYKNGKQYNYELENFEPCWKYMNSVTSE